MGYDPKTLRGEVPFFRVEMDDDLYEDCVLRDDHIALVEAKDAEIARLTAAAENHNAAWVAACDRIAELEAERDAMNEELREARMQAIADGVQFQMDMEDLTAERDEALIRAERSERAERAAHDAANTAIRQRDEARALLALISTKQGIGHVAPNDATTALAARDAAMRNEGRRQVKVKPLVWEEYAPSCFFGRGEFGDYSIAPSASAYHEGEIRISGLDGGFTYATAIEAAKAAAQADYEARILAALEPEGGE